MNDTQNFDPVITVPENPFWSVTKRFGRDEVFALLFNVAATSVAVFLGAGSVVLVLVGPVLEKVGLFSVYGYEALLRRAAEPPAARAPWYRYFSQVWRAGLPSLLEDVCIHDPVYIALMAAGLLYYPAMPVWMLVVVSFVIGVLAVAVFEVAYTEFRYWLHGRALQRAGFSKESYYEARFLITTAVSPSVVFDRVTTAFSLTRAERTMEYRDVYYRSVIPNFSNRTSVVRLRDRNYEEEGDQVRTAQVVFTKAREARAGSYEQYRYFPVRKDKFYFKTPAMPERIEDIENVQAQKVLLLRVDAQYPPQHIHFTRSVASDKELLISVDEVRSDNVFFIVEVKVYSDLLQLRRAMRFIMQEFPVHQTTESKQEIL